jgi:uncharacterized protein YhjY with autotransporter beta-barrel domain
VTTLGLTWNPSSQDGGSEILDYRINIAELGSEFNILDTSTNANYLAIGLTAGTTYEFKIESRNQFGYS